MTTVLVFGTFDKLHEGHIHFLAEARRLGHRLVAPVSRDDFVRDFKNKEPEHDEQVRRRRLVDRGLVDEAFLSDRLPGTYEALRRILPDVLCLGYDQDRLRDSLTRRMGVNSLGIPIVTLEHYEGDELS